MTFELELLIISALILFSIGLARLMNNIGMPAILLFLGVGMLAGSEGPGGIHFNDAELTRSIGTVALIFILFSGGLDTHWPTVKTALRPALLLASLGVFLTALLVGSFAYVVLGMDPGISFLVGAIVSSTDAAAVFSVLRSQKMELKKGIRPLLELESGSNDPMAIFLTISVIQALTLVEFELFTFVELFFFQWVVGGLVGYSAGRLIVFAVNRMHFSVEGVYPPFMLASAVFVYAFTAVLNGSGFLAVYISALMIGNSEFIHKRSTLRFFDGLAWLSQISMFLTLGLLVYPTALLPTSGMAISIALFLILIARPVAVYLALSFESYTIRDLLFISWVGLRGAIPIILATFPLLAGMAGADQIFNIVFFIVLMSALLQGWSIPYVARFLKLDRIPEDRDVDRAWNMIEDSSMELIDIIVPYACKATGQPLINLSLPANTLIVLISRGEKFILPRGNTVIEGGDVLLLLTDENKKIELSSLFNQSKFVP